MFDFWRFANSTFILKSRKTYTFAPDQQTGNGEKLFYSIKSTESFAISDVLKRPKIHAKHAVSTLRLYDLNSIHITRLELVLRQKHQFPTESQVISEFEYKTHLYSMAI